MIIKFNGTEINGNAFAKITKSGKVYDKNFKLGSTICETYKIQVNKEYIEEMPNVVTLYDGETLLKTLYVVDINDSDDVYYELSLEDAMTKFNFRYDASEIFVDDHTTLLAIFQDICSKAGVDTDIDSFYGSTMQISVYDNTYMARDYLGYIAEINACNLRISADDKLEFVEINTEPVETIDFEDISNFKIGVQHTITRVVLGDWQIGDTTGETYYINEDNPYAMSQATVQHIYDMINGFTYYNFKTNNCPMANLKIGDLVKFTYNDNEYVTFVQFDNIYFSKNEWFGGLEVNLDSPVKQETEIVGEQDRFRRIKRIVDIDHGRIDQIIETTPVITTQQEGVGGVYLQNLANTKLVELRIHPTNKDILGLFASNLLKVASGLKALSRGVTFDNTNGTENDLYYKLPENLYYYDQDVYDEFVYDGANERIYVIRRVAVDEQGNKSPLIEPITEEYEYQDLVIAEGDYNIFMKSYPSAYIYVKAMIKNDYTDLFATTYELGTAISQTERQIELLAQEKVDENEIIAKLNVAVENHQGIIELVGNTVTIDSDNFKLDADGKITATEGDIGGFNMNSTSFSKALNGIYNYTIQDAVLVLQINQGYMQNTNIDYILDYNNDGVVDLFDGVKILNIVQRGDTNEKVVTGTFEIKSNDPKNCLVFKNNNGQVTTSIGLGGINTDYLSTNNFACGTFNAGESGFGGCLINGEDGTLVIRSYESNGAYTRIEPGKITLYDGNGNTKVITATS